MERYTHVICGEAVLFLTMYYKWPVSLYGYFSQGHAWSIFWYSWALFVLAYFLSWLPDVDIHLRIHRGFMHTVWAYLLVSIPFAVLYLLLSHEPFGVHKVLFAIAYGLNVALPYLVHIAMDCLTFGGITPFAPVWNVELSGPFAVGEGKTEVSFSLIGLGIWAYLFWNFCHNNVPGWGPGELAHSFGAFFFFSWVPMLAFLIRASGINRWLIPSRPI